MMFSGLGMREAKAGVRTVATALFARAGSRLFHRPVPAAILRGMRIVLACLAFVIAAACYVLVIASTVMSVRMHFRGEFHQMLADHEETLVRYVSGLVFYAFVGTVVLCVGLTVLAKSRRGESS